MKNIDFIYKSNEFNLTFDEDSLSSIVDYNFYFKQSKTNTAKTLISESLDMPFLSGTAEKINRNQIEFEYFLPNEYTTYQKWLAKSPVSTISKSLLDFTKKIESNTNYKAIVHPDNLLVDNFDNIWVANRLLKTNKADIFKDLKTLAAASFSGFNFSDLDNGNIVDFLNDDQYDLLNSANYQEFTERLGDTYFDNLDFENSKKITITKNKRMWSRIFTIFSAIALPILAFLAGYQNFELSKQGYKFEVNRLLNASLYTSKNEKERNSNIHELLKTPDVLDELSDKQERDVVYYVIKNSKDLKGDDKNKILNDYKSKDENNYTFDKDYVKSWIFIEQNEYQRAYDLSSTLEKGKGDFVLMRISLDKLVYQIKNDKSLTAQERQSKLDSLQKSDEELNEKIAAKKKEFDDKKKKQEAENKKKKEAENKKKKQEAENKKKKEDEANSASEQEQPQIPIIPESAIEVSDGR